MKKAAREISFYIDNGVYPFEALKAAAVTFSNRAQVFLQESGEKTRVRLEPLTPVADAANLKNCFFNEALHHVLRLQTARDNRRVVELVVARALLSSQPKTSSRKRK